MPPPEDGRAPVDHGGATRKAGQDFERAASLDQRAPDGVDPAPVPMSYLDHFRARVLQDALAEALPVHWRRRAEQFGAVGNAACDEVATACRSHAEFLEQHPIDLAELVAAELGRAA